MGQNLKSGIHLEVIPTDKYKTVRVLIRFKTKINKRNMAQRVLLANLLETNSKKYPDNNQISQVLADMYGASFGVNVSKKGTEHLFSIMMTMVNERYLPSATDLFAQGIAFINEIIFNPNVDNELGKFDEATFAREKKNISEYIKSIADDKQAYSASKLYDLLYRHDIDQATPSYGDITDVEELSNEEVYRAYRDMLSNDQVDIVVIGDVDESEITEQVRKLSFEPREDILTDFLYKKDLQNGVISEEELQPITQSKLNLAYRTNIFYREHDYYALQVFNGIFGGFPHSKLFMNVREKASLAYYASSSIDTFKGILTIQTGIDQVNKDQVLSLINEQLQEMVDGNFNDEVIEQTKMMLKNQLLLSLDNISAICEMSYINHYYASDVDYIKRWITEVEKVSREDIQRVAQQIELKGMFFLKGVKNDD